ncbi:hypothetical protein [Apibacter sp. HY039]|uniref:hypothetical protein n=1 Tax=Apibacter sp. HY039 TaxID=2501476 RepID=UPI000FEB86E3|nr:hypothetical protein [Apibacter sp. HY039]
MNLPQSSHKIGIIGCGWLGFRLAKYLSAQYALTVTTTTPSKVPLLNSEGFSSHLLDLSSIFFESNTHLKNELSETTHIILSIPFSKKALLSEIKIKIKNLLTLLEGYRGIVILFSSIGIYPDTGQPISEDTIDPCLLNKNLHYVENSLQSAFSDLLILRLGGLMGDDRFFSKYFKNKPIPNPYSRVNHIHYTDICRLVKKLIEYNYNKKTYNLVAPLHPTKVELFNFQMNKKENDIVQSENTFQSGKIVSSEKITTELNYQFTYPDPLNFK